MECLKAAAMANLREKAENVSQRRTKQELYSTSLESKMKRYWKTWAAQYLPTWVWIPPCDLSARVVDGTGDGGEGTIELSKRRPVSSFATGPFIPTFVAQMQDMSVNVQ